jgi:DNA-binding IclR family transcriptional regulator
LHNWYCLFERVEERTGLTLGSLDRAVHILRYLAEKGKAASLSDISRDTGIPVSSAHRILSSLQAHCFIMQDERQYRLGFALVPLAQSALKNLSEYGDVMPYLAEVRDRWNEVSSICAIVDNHVVCLQVASVVNEPHRTQFFVRAGQIMPFNGSASGKVILAFQDQDMIEAIISTDQFIAYTPKTITDPKDFNQHLKIIRDQGYALCEEELEVGVSAAAVPIKSVSGRVNSCLVVVAPSVRLQSHIEDGLMHMLKSVSERMSLCSIAN